MLTKNIYILYPAGYSGSYINWAINISDTDTAPFTILDPVNRADSDNYGGQGTSHLHKRIPTHQGLDAHLAWYIYNKPADKRVYIINSATDNNVLDTYLTIRQIIQYDPDGVFINIHNNNDAITGAYGTINCITKWPIFIEGMLALKVSMGHQIPELNFDADTCKDDREFRNWVVKYGDLFFKQNRRLDRDKVLAHAQSISDWFSVRSSKNPEEVDASMYIHNISMDNRLFELSCKDIASDAFVDWFKDFMLVSTVSNSYTTEHVSAFHHNYVSAQKNLQWFTSIANWELTGQLDSYLTSHSGIEAQMILHIFKQSGRQVYYDDKKRKINWLLFYNNVRGEASWPPVKDEVDFFRLPRAIQNELVESGYCLPETKPLLEIVDLEWEDLSLLEINEVFQKVKNR